MGEQSDFLNEQQLKAATFEGKHLLVLAGAGTGKTRTIIARAKHLVQSGTPEHRILILSFTRKSSKEIVERIRAEIGHSSGALRGQTFHSWCCELIHSNPEIFPQSGYTLLDEDDVESCFKLLCKDGVLDANGHAIKPSQIASVFSYARNTRISLSEALTKKLDNGRIPPDKLPGYIESCRAAYADVIKKYIQYKRDRLYMDYDDALTIVANGLKNNPEARHFIAGKYDHILIDEMQDTNPLQYDLIENFYEQCHLFCVGDDAQSIYAFRGADFNSIHHFAEVVPNAQVLKLTINYRSSQEILDLSNWVLKNSPLNYDKNLTASRGHGVKPAIVHWDSNWEEGNLVTDKIIKFQNNGGSWHDHMVLSRSSYGLKQVEGCCIKKAIPYVIYGGISLMQSKHIRDVLAAIRIAANCKDELAWMRYLELWKGIGNVRASRILAAILQNDNLNDILSVLPSLVPQKELIQALKVAAENEFAPARAIQEVLHVMEPTLQATYKNEWDWRKSDFPILTDIAANSSNITDFVTEYIIDPRLGELLKQNGQKTTDCVVLTTIHSAKGLEAKVCHVINLNPESWPAPQAIASGQDEIEEERRCLYVALTRAKDFLFLYRDVRAARASVATKHFSTKIPAKVRAKLEAKYNAKSNNLNNAYFLNALPESLFTRENTSKPRLDNQFYSGKMISEDDDCFDFS